MKKVIYCITIIAFLFACNISIAAPITDNSINKIMDLSGLRKQVAEYPAMIIVGIDQAHQQNPSIQENELAGMKRAIEKAFIPEDFVIEISSEMKRNITEEEANQLINWFESSMGQQLVSAEVAATKPEALQNMLAEAQTLFSDTSRVSVAQEIDNLVGATDMSTQIQLDTAIAVFTSVSSAFGQNQREAIDSFKAQLAAQKDQMRQSMEQLTILTFLYSYKGIDQNTLEQYINFLSKPNTLKFNESVKNGMKSAFAKGINEMAKSLGILFSSQES